MDDVQADGGGHDLQTLVEETVTMVPPFPTTAFVTPYKARKKEFIAR